MLNMYCTLKSSLSCGNNLVPFSCDICVAVRTREETSIPAAGRDLIDRGV